jgi:hypothetical protein
LSSGTSGNLLQEMKLASLGEPGAGAALLGRGEAGVDDLTEETEGR